MRVVTALIPLLAAVACRDGKPSVTSRAAPPPSAAEDGSPTTARTVDPSAQLSPVINRLRYEGQHRPAVPFAAERVLDELERGGLTVVARRQYLGASMRASYCLGGTTRDGVAVSVCEYPSTAAAVDGKRFMDQRFQAMAPQATRLVRESTVLSIASYREDGSSTAARALDIFAAMTPQGPTQQQQENL